jgi:hypothetical protein
MEGNKMASTKDIRLEPLWVFREELVARRRAAAMAKDLKATLQAQLDLEVIDRALADELKAAH